MNIPEELKRKAKDELINNILPFWDNNMPDVKYGGFHGRIDGYNNIIADAPKGGILNARILWAYAAVYNQTGITSCLDRASGAAGYILDHFFDNRNGGTWWSLTAKGKPLNKKKQIYSQAYFIYALSEYYRSSAEKQFLEKAIELYRLIEDHAYDEVNEGYLEAFSHDWQHIDDQRLSVRDTNEKKSMNTHLHVLEAYTNLYSVWPDESLRSQLVKLLNVFTGRIIDPKTGHLNLFFDEQWNIKSDIISYGHEIEASWLLCEAAGVLESKQLHDSLVPVSLRSVNSALEGLQDDGSLIYEKSIRGLYTDTDRHWWVQAEAVVGLLNAWELTGEERYLEMAYSCFNYITENLVDKDNGEWHWSIRADGTINRAGDKAGFWKCPYHNSRMCLEIMRRL